MGASQPAYTGESAGGKCRIGLASFLKSRICWSIAEAERIKGSPPWTPEVVVVFQRNYTGRINNGWLNAFLQNLYREDLFYADKQFTYWSMEGPDGSEERKTFERFSERFFRLYPGYMLDKHMHIVAKPETPVINLQQLVSLLKSKDAELWEQSKWMFDPKHFRYLDGAPNKSNKVAFCSFPRSGNTFLRKYLELMTGIQTGADNTLHVNVALQMQGMKGEDITDDTCWVIKSHSPWVMPEAPVFSANKVVCIVRNPLDTNLSWLHLVAMNNHAMKSPLDYEKVYPEYFDWWVKDCCGHINNWMLTMMRDAKFRNVPMLFIRFEDLVMNPEPELYNMMSFLLGVRDLSGTNAERRIKEVLAMDQRATQTYSLKDSTKRNNGNAHRYTPEQLAWVGENLKEWLYFFGYAKVPQDPDNNTGFFEYDG